MATIVWQRAVADGYNVTIDTGGARHTVHFTSTPTTAARDDAIDSLERRITDTIAAETVVESEEILNPEEEDDGVPEQ